MEAKCWYQNYIHRSQNRRLTNILEKNETLQLAKESLHISSCKGNLPCISLLQTFKTTAEGVHTVHVSIDKIFLTSDSHIAITAFCNNTKTNYIT